MASVPIHIREYIKMLAMQLPKFYQYENGKQKFHPERKKEFKGSDLIAMGNTRFANGVLINKNQWYQYVINDPMYVDHEYWLLKCYEENGQRGIDNYIKTCREKAIEFGYKFGDVN